MDTTVRTDQAPEASIASLDITRAQRVVSWAIAVLAVSTLLALVSYLDDWSDLFNGEAPEADEWLALGASLWLPVVVYTMYRLVRVHRALAATAHEAVDAFRDTVDTAHGWVWRVDADQRIVYSSDGIRALLGHEPHDVIGRHAIDLLIPEEDQEAVMADLSARFGHNGWRDLQSRVKHRDGSTRYVRSSATPVRGKGGRLLGYRGCTADATAEVVAAAAQQAAQQAQQEARARIEQVLSEPDALHTVLQPIIDVSEHRITGMEALSRFTSEPYRSPDLWFADAWQAGLGPDLELHAISRAFQQLPHIPQHAYLSVNASPLTIIDARFAALVAELGANSYRVVVEVTEHAAVNDYETLSVAVEHLRRTGVRLAVDDAGAGYSSMTHVLRLRPDVIKLDRGIVADIDHDAARRALVTAMAGFAASLDMTVVAEGVENAAELAVLTEAGVRHAQGFYLARPSTDPSPKVFKYAGAVR